MCSELFLRVAELCLIFAYRTRHTPCVASCFFGSLNYVCSSVKKQGTHRVSSGRSVMSNLRLYNKAHAVCSELFLRVAGLCQIFAHRTWHTPSVANCFFGSLSYVPVRSSLTEQGTRGVYWVVSPGRSVMSDLRLQNKAHAVCGEFFFRVAQLCLIFAYRARRKACIVSCFRLGHSVMSDFRL